MKIRRLTANELKLIAITAMVIDHFAWAFVAFDSVEGQILHMIGRITAPVMCFFIAQGYCRTRNLKKYILRLCAFGAVSQIPYMLFKFNLPGNKGFRPELFELNVMFGLLMGLLMIAACERLKNDYLNYVAIAGCLLVSIFCDWGVIVPMWCFTFWLFRDRKLYRNISFVIIALVYVYLAGGIYLCYFGTLLGLGLVCLYGGLKNANRRSVGSNSGKWFFYAFYPIHLMILYLMILWYNMK